MTSQKKYEDIIQTLSNSTTGYDPQHISALRDCADRAIYRVRTFLGNGAHENAFDLAYGEECDAIGISEE